MNTATRTEKTIRAMLLFVSGAYAVVIYINHQIPAMRDQMTDLRDSVGAVWFVLMALTTYFDWKNRKLADVSEPSPVWSGVHVVVATGLAATVALAWGFRTLGDLIPAAGALVLTAIAALLVGRFASKHAGEIGEARFAPSPTSTEDS